MATADLTAEQLRTSNVRVIRGNSGIAHRIVPVPKLIDPVKRYLPPAGPYYDQSILDASTGIFTENRRCVFCWNREVPGQKCECKLRCAVCDTKEHRGFECPKMYVGMRWWRDHNHRPRPKAQIRPNPGERAYLVIAGVFKDWRKLEDAVVINMDHPIVKEHYKGKAAPQALKTPNENYRALDTTNECPSASRHARGEKATQNDAHDGEAVVLSIGTNEAPKPPESKQNQKSQQTRAEIPVVQPSSDPGERDRNSRITMSGFGNLNGKWRPLSYHEGISRVTITPLSFRLALTQQQAALVRSSASPKAGNLIRSDLDPRLQSRTQPKDDTQTPEEMGSIKQSEGTLPVGSALGASNTIAGHKTNSVQVIKIEDNEELNIDYEPTRVKKARLLPNARNRALSSQPPDSMSATPPPTPALSHAYYEKTIREKEEENRRYREDLRKLRDEIEELRDANMAKDRKIRELEHALYEAETKREPASVTYGAGYKRPRLQTDLGSGAEDLEMHDVIKRED